MKKRFSGATQELIYLCLTGLIKRTTKAFRPGSNGIQPISREGKKSAPTSNKVYKKRERGIEKTAQSTHFGIGSRKDCIPGSMGLGGGGGRAVKGGGANKKWGHQLKVKRIEGPRNQVWAFESCHDEKDRFKEG